MATGALVFAIAIAAIADAVPSSDLRLELIFESNVFSRRDPITVTAVIINTGKLSIEVPRVMIPPAYWIDFEIQTPEGGKAKVTTHTTSRLTDGRIVLEPGQGFATRFGLANYYSMQKPGKYTVRAVYGRPPTEGAPVLGPVESKAITIRII